MSDLTGKTYYEILGISQDASVDQIKEAYKNIARAYHPDSNFYDEILQDQKDSPDQDTFKQITEAYNTLISAERRKAYDELFPKGLRDWDDIERNVEKSDANLGRSYEGVSATTYRPRVTGAFRSSTFGVVQPVTVQNESAIDTALKGRSITPVEAKPERNIIPLFLTLLIGGFLAGAAIAYLLISRS